MSEAKKPGRLSGRCPFCHVDGTLAVNDTLGLFYCFNCETGGSTLRLATAGQPAGNRDTAPAVGARKNRVTDHADVIRQGLVCPVHQEPFCDGNLNGCATVVAAHAALDALVAERDALATDKAYIEDCYNRLPADDPRVLRRDAEAAEARVKELEVRDKMRDDGERHLLGEIEARDARVKELEQRWEKDNTCGICPYRMAIQARVKELEAALREIENFTFDVMDTDEYQSGRMKEIARAVLGVGS